VAEHDAEKSAADAARAKHDEVYASKQAAQVVLNDLRDQVTWLASGLVTWLASELVSK